MIKGRLLGALRGVRHHAMDLPQTIPTAYLLLQKLFQNCPICGRIIFIRFVFTLKSFYGLKSSLMLCFSNLYYRRCPQRLRLALMSSSLRYFIIILLKCFFFFNLFLKGCLSNCTSLCEPSNPLQIFTPLILLCNRSIFQRLTLLWK